MGFRLGLDLHIIDCSCFLMTSEKSISTDTRTRTVGQNQVILRLLIIQFLRSSGVSERASKRSDEDIGVRERSKPMSKLC